MPEYDFPNLEGLREIETIYAPKSVLPFQNNGRVCLRRNISKNPEFVRKRLKVKNRHTGEIADVPEERTVAIQYTCDQVQYPEGEWLLIEEYDDYPREKPQNASFGYYLLPSDPLPGERLFIPKLLEDVYVTEFWGVTVLRSGIVPAFWSGTVTEFWSGLATEFWSGRR